MFKLLRRISSSVLPRNDRPWADDATSTAPTIGTKRRLSSVDMDLDTPVGSLSKKSRIGKDADASEDEGPDSSPVLSSPLPSRSSAPPEDVKEVTTGVKEIELGQEPSVSLPDPSEAAEPPAVSAAETSAEADKEVKTDADEDPILERRSEEGNVPEAKGSQDSVNDDTTDEIPVVPAQEPTDDLKDTTETSEEGGKPLILDCASPTKVSRSRSTVEEPVVSENMSGAEA